MLYNYLFTEPNLIWALIIIGIPILEIILMIEVGQKLGAINTVLLVLLTAIVGVYYARIEGLNTIRSGFTNVYRNKTPIYEIISGASIAIAAFLLILPGFLTDGLGFLLLIPFTRKIIVKNFINKKNLNEQPDDVIEAEIIEEKKRKDDEL